MTTQLQAPWMLPPPPQPPSVPMAEAVNGNGHMRSKHAAASHHNHPPVFAFQRRNMKLDWSKIAHIDLNDVIQQVDLSLLHEYLLPLTFSDVSQADLAFLFQASHASASASPSASASSSATGRALHVTRFFQLVLEYTLFAWRATHHHAEEQRAKYLHTRQQLHRLKRRYRDEVEEKKMLKKEMSYLKKVIHAIEKGGVGGGALSRMIEEHEETWKEQARQIARDEAKEDAAAPAEHSIAPVASTSALPTSTQSSPSYDPYSSALAQQALFSNVHHHYTSIFQQLHQQLSDEVRNQVESLKKSNEQRATIAKRKMQNVEAAINIMMDALKVEGDKEEKKEEQNKENHASHLTHNHEDEKESTPTPSKPHKPSTPASVVHRREAQQRLLASMLNDIRQMQQASGPIRAHAHAIDANNVQGIEKISIAPFDPSTVPPPSIDMLSPLPSRTIGRGLASSAAAATATEQRSPRPSAPTFLQPPTDTTTTQQHRRRSSRVYNFGIQSPRDQQPSSTNIAASASASAPASSPTTSSAIAPSSFSSSSFTPAQHAEIAHLAQWLRNMEAEEIGAEITKMQLEASIAARNAEEERRRKREQEEAEAAARQEQELRRMEEQLPPDHPLLQDTILATRPLRLSSTATTAHSPMPAPNQSPLTNLSMPAHAPSPVSPSADTASIPSTPIQPPPPRSLTIAIMSPASIPLSRPTAVGNALLMPAPTLPSSPPRTVPTLASATSTVAGGVSAGPPPAPLADSAPLPSPEEKAASLMTLTPSSRIHAIEYEKSMIKLRAIIQAKSPIPSHAMYTPFPSLPFLGSLVHHTPEQLRDHYDVIYTWCSTAMRSEEGAKELLTYAVQMDPTAEIYDEVKEKIDKIAEQYYTPPQEFIEEQQRLQQLELMHLRHGEEEHARRLRDARWHDERIRAFEQQWMRLQTEGEDREFYEAVQKKHEQDQREREFQAYLRKLQQQIDAERKARIEMERALSGGIAPPEKLKPVAGEALIPPTHREQVRAYRAGYSPHQPLQQMYASPSIMQGVNAAAALQRSPSRSPLHSGSRIKFDIYEGEEDEIEGQPGPNRSPMQSTAFTSPHSLGAGASASPSRSPLSGAARSPTRTPASLRDESGDERAAATLMSASASRRGSTLSGGAAFTTSSPSKHDTAKLISLSPAQPISTNDTPLPTRHLPKPVSGTRVRPFNDEGEEEDEEEEEEDDSMYTDEAARRAVCRAAQSSFDAPSSSLFNRPSGAALKGRPTSRHRQFEDSAGIVESISIPSNQTPDRSSIPSLHSSQPALADRPTTAVGSSSHMIRSRPTAPPHATRRPTPTMVAAAMEDSFERELREEEEEGIQEDGIDQSPNMQQGTPKRGRSPTQNVSSSASSRAAHSRRAQLPVDIRGAVQGQLVSTAAPARESANTPEIHGLPAIALDPTGPITHDDVSDVDVLNLDEVDSAKPSPALRPDTAVGSAATVMPSSPDQVSSEATARSPPTPTPPSASVGVGGVGFGFGGLGSSSASTLIQSGRGRPTPLATATSTSTGASGVSGSSGLSSLVGVGVGVGGALSMRRPRPAGRGLLSTSNRMKHLTQQDMIDDDSPLELDDE